ncbi:YoaK family protein [Granulicella sp. S190]|uniref:YoaK family protein n=1 Tax=Granulicella sp. S190 TaxID=1747226 RepID=UPI00131B4555|nr:YoaK family protein [Granulicella sp. S190]
MLPPNPILQPNSLPDAMLLAGTGGLLDAIVYLNHGHVFANAMTGNVIFLGIATLGRNWHDIIPHLVPIVGFLAGVTGSKHLRSGYRYSAPLGLAFEILALFVLGSLSSGFPSMIFTFIIAFVSAFQVASFRRVERFAFNSTFITGNLRDLVEGLYEALTPSATPEAREQGRAQAINLGLICLCFLVGAIIGAWVAPRFANHALWLAEPLLIVVFLRVLRRIRNAPAPTPQTT